MGRNPVNHNMIRRAPWHNYDEPGTYLITLIVNGRSPEFGNLVDCECPYISLSALGRQIQNAEIEKIHAQYPNVDVWDLVIMPDHMHMIVNVSEKFPNKKHLGSVVYGFKTGCTRAWWSLNGLEPGGKTPGTVALDAQHAPKDTQHAPKDTQHAPEDTQYAPKDTQHAPEANRNHSKDLPVLFKKGYTDGILMNDGQLDAWKHYIADNPRRLAIKRRNPQFFTVLHDIDICGHKCQIVGNRFLLNIPDKEVVIVHRATSDAEFAALKNRWLACGERGGVIISASIAPREKEVMREAMDKGYRIILLRENGFPKLYKPAGEAFDACARGQLLQISPWDFHYDRRVITREQCLFLNSLAQKIAESNDWY